LWGSRVVETSSCGVDGDRREENHGGSIHGKRQQQPDGVGLRRTEKLEHKL
jgi:hypothetical protein